MHADNPQYHEGYWENVGLELVTPDNGFRTQEQVYIPSDKAQRIIVSDIDDTVMYTGVANKLRMLWRVYAQGAEARTAFPGVGQFYKALHHGAFGDENNPVLYISRAPWSIYECSIFQGRPGASMKYWMNFFVSKICRIPFCYCGSGE